MFGFFRRRRRAKIKLQPFSGEWISILENNVPYYGMLTPEEREELRGHILVFLHEKNFVSAGGLEITDEVRVTIAAQACILLLGRETEYYPSLRTILVYPDTFFVEQKKRMPDGSVSEGLGANLGESWHRGPVVLSWSSVKRGAYDARDAHNVVFHEFAHQLDGDYGRTDGAPLLPERSMYTAWARVLTTEYEQLLSDLEHHRRHCLDSYAATNPAEFFAVVTETFFENPQKLLRCHPELYEQMKLFYKQDPVKRYEVKRK